jgi:hypothetical protein
LSSSLIVTNFLLLRGRRPEVKKMAKKKKIAKKRRRGTSTDSDEGFGDREGGTVSGIFVSGRLEG